MTTYIKNNTSASFNPPGICIIKQRWINTTSDNGRAIYTDLFTYHIYYI